MTQGRGLFATASAWIASNTTFTILQGWAAPTVVSVATALAGWVGAYPLFYIIPATAFAFAMTATAILRFRQLLENTTTANKVTITAPYIARALSIKDPSLYTIKLGLTAVNRASFPMEIALEKLETQIADRVPTAKFEPRTLPVEAQTGVQFTNDAIDLTDVDRVNKLLYATINGAVSYGRRGHRDRTTDYSVTVALRFDEHGELQFAEPSMTGFKPEPL